MCKLGKVDIEFKSSVPVFDCNVSLGRIHTSRLVVDSAEETILAMDHVGVEKALIHNPYGVNYDPVYGNEKLMKSIEGVNRFIPQFTCNPSTFDIHTFSENVENNNVKALRMEPSKQNFPFVNWIVGDCMDWIVKKELTLFIPVTDLNPVEFHNTMKLYPNSKVVLSDVHYSHVPWAIPLLKALPNLYVEISKFSISDSLIRLLNVVGEGRILYGSKFPYQPMGPQLYSLHRWGISEASLKAICSENLKIILGL